MRQGWLRREDSTLPDGYGGKAGEDLTEEKILLWASQQGVHLGDRGRSVFQPEARGREQLYAGQWSKGQGAGQGACWGRGAEFRSCGSLDLIITGR